jgi:signal transduction histidine kinase
MMTTGISKFFKRERKNTDDSLNAERDKATQSLKTANTKSQGQTDELVKDERSLADQKTVLSRADHDDSRDESASAIAQKISMDHLSEERRIADLATGLERAKVDAAILKERKVATKLVSDVLDIDRRATDENLLLERDKADLVFDGSKNLLRSEVADHLRTKVSLTSRDEFLAIVSHDLKNPLGSVSGYAELLLDGVDGEVLGAQSRKFVEAIERSAQISLRLIDDLLDIERFAQSKLELKKSTNDANDLVAQAAEIFQHVALERNVTLKAKTGTTAAALNCDRDRILQVLNNLIGNALKFTPAGGTVSVELTNANGRIEFSVCDTGPGIPESKRKEIFGRFAQLHSKNRDGLGLGLYISKMLVEAHGGSLNVESVVGQGSTFRFQIPSATSLTVAEGHESSSHLI